ncbi:MerR family transcriptional regulator [Micromonospora sediminimaris]|uniref:MerR family transcriptional regulator n=1 Tax=Micromonospora sediminimaris TaxID=547162 RepID=A0A9W5USL9_9ACTN|nr:MerR family transcriptional regulator [Micromonospora sediminimaris]GIJ33503.1 MerR family transcriptional regulator [Micromonospora sediminimaris]
MALGEGSALLIGELSERTGVSARLLRYYEQQGLLRSARAANGYRHYAVEDVEKVRRIRSLLNVGLPLRTVELLLPCVVDASPRVIPCENLVATLRQEVARLDEASNEIDRCRTLILDILHRSGADELVGASTGS